MGDTFNWRLERGGGGLKYILPAAVNNWGRGDHPAPQAPLLQLLHVYHLRWLEIVYWHARPVPLNTATESRPMHTTFKLNMLRAREHQARACANNDLVPLKSLENLDFDQKYL